MIEGQEIFVILLVALVVLGPSRLPELARRLGGWSADLRRAARELRRGLESEVGDLKQVRDDLQAPLREIQQPFKEVDAVMRDAQKDVRDVRRAATKDIRSGGSDESSTDSGKKVSWIGPVPSSGPTPSDAAEDLAAIEETGMPVTDAPVTDAPVTDEEAG